MMLDELDRAIIALLQQDIPLDETPYAALAARLNLSVEELLERLRSLQEWGGLRRIGAVLRHQQAGFTANAMGVWAVPPSEVERVGPIMASFPEVTHCYERPTFEDWPFNLYTMIHGKDPEECGRVAEQISQKTGITHYRLLFSLRELKKTSMSYF
ncbi:MAG: Lrp/AsnC family transcriptional regulator [Candidatus Tectomicrobia bacterium]|uniref:siroheme decarboxylase n=1 Tax=Tectimicrobiota bacterium TaxID=2528274 RepID=A0A932CN18_UNCTE|nr:Lrp/AsnC family transcriptional regulator [Candidatus Tectomicrobia bacterium]